MQQFLDILRIITAIGLFAYAATCIRYSARIKNPFEWASAISVGFMCFVYLIPIVAPNFIETTTRGVMFAIAASAFFFVGVFQKNADWLNSKMWMRFRVWRAMQQIKFRGR